MPPTPTPPQADTHSHSHTQPRTPTPPDNDNEYEDICIYNYIFPQPILFVVYVMSLRNVYV